MDDPVRTASPIRSTLAVVGAFALTIAACIWVASILPRDEMWREAPSGGQGTRLQREGEGVLVRIEAGDGIRIERDLPSPNFVLRAGESLDPRVPGGPFTATLRLPVESRFFERTRYGVAFSGGSVVVRSASGRVLIDAVAGAEVETAWSPLTHISGAAAEVEVAFERIGSGACSLRVLWEPDVADLPHALALRNVGWIDRDDFGRGLALVQTLHCVRCHQSTDAQLTAILEADAPPELGAAGARLRPQWLRRWIRDPVVVKRDATMPAMFDHAPIDDETIEDIVHFLVSLGGPMEPIQPAMHTRAAEEGMLLYYAVGCFACHGEAEAMRESAHPFAREFDSIPDQAAKTSITALSAFLRDPLHVRPGGRMPSLALSGFEADAIAAYLMSLGDDGTESSDFLLDSARVARGRDAFEALDCGACHEVPEVFGAVASQPTAPSFEMIAASPMRGCMSDDTTRERGVRYALEFSDRRAIREFLRAMNQRRSSISAIDATSATLHRLQCLRCHEMNGDGGPGVVVRDYFRSLDPDDSTDEGRFPPRLTDVGARLRLSSLEEVLVASARARPHMATRMPHFGERNVGMLAQGLVMLSGHEGTGADGGETRPSGHADAGRALVGVGGLNCIECHSIAGRPSTGLPGVDLADLPARMHHAAFHRFVDDPDLERPGTRMPTFFIDGTSASIAYLNGDAKPQIDAMWNYLSDVEAHGLPEGLAHPPPDPGESIVATGDETVAVRAFLAGSGERVIAIGSPAGVSFAFDIDRCRLAAIWTGPFYPQGGLLEGSGHAEPPRITQDVVWRPPDGATFVGGETPMIGWQLLEGNLAFVRYRLERDETVFEYRLAGAGAAVEVVERIEISNEPPSSPRLIRHFTLRAAERAIAWFNLGGESHLVEAAALENDVSARDDGLIPLVVEPSAPVEFWVEISEHFEDG